MGKSTQTPLRAVLGRYTQWGTNRPKNPDGKKHPNPLRAVPGTNRPKKTRMGKPRGDHCHRSPFPLVSNMSI